MATPKKGWGKKAFEAAKRNKWTAAGCGAAWLVGIPLVPGVVELIALGGAGYVADHKNKQKQDQDQNGQKQLPKPGAGRSIWDNNKPK